MKKPLNNSDGKILRGKDITWDRRADFEVIGIVTDFKFESYHNAVEPLALLFTGADFGNVLSVRLTTGNTGQQIDQIMKIWKSISPYEPFSFIFYDDFFQSMYVKEEKLASSITFFSLIAVALTCMGILGQIFMICLTRVKEIGIRKINGARVSEVLIMLNLDFIKLVVLAFLVAAPVAFYIMQKWLENFAYKTRLRLVDFRFSRCNCTFHNSGHSSWQSWRAATRNPVEALRYE